MESEDTDYTISVAAYEWSVRVFSIVRRLLGVNIKLHHGAGQIDAGDIFLFNHFARFETFIPQYLIYQESGVYCRSVASSEFFEDDDAMSAYLRGVGAIPNDHPRLLPMLAEEILRGRKVIVFPEGGMVKDRRVQDAPGKYSVYSRTAMERRKMHRGAAVLAYALDAFKFLVRQAAARGRYDRLEALAGGLRLESTEQLLAAVRRPTAIVPANITFYPIRVSDNVLRKGMELFNRGLSRRASEELLIEGNILLKHTDMDIRFGDSLLVDGARHWWERKLLSHAASRIASLDDLFALQGHAGGWDTRVLARRLRRESERVRDRYMHQMYTGVTVNLSHLASAIISQLLEARVQEVEHDLFHRMLYLAVKKVQQQASVNLHRSLRNPQAYGQLIRGGSEGLAQFLETAARMALVHTEPHRYVFQPKLLDEHEFDEIRLENLVEVYANEVEPLSAVTRCVGRAIAEAPSLDRITLADLRYDDQLRAYAWDKAYFAKPRYADINALQTATRDGNWFRFVQDRPSALGVVLVHGFLASPAELFEFGARLRDRGYSVIGVRLKGHGTSPWDLRERRWQDWFHSVRRGFDIMSAYAERVCVVGFSTGGALALRLAAEHPTQLAGVSAVAVPIKFQDRNMMFVPLVHGANRLVRWASSFEGVMPFRQNASEHPEINYAHIPIRGLYELRLLVAELERRLPQVVCPVTVVQGDRDPVVVPESARIVFEKISSQDKELIMVSSEHHGILNADIDGTQEHVLSFLERVSERQPVPDAEGISN